MLRGNTEKRIAKLETNFKKLKNIEKALKSLAKEVKENSRDLDKSIDSHEKFKSETEKIFKNISKTFDSIKNDHKKFNKQFKKLTQTNDTLKRDLKTAKNTIIRINRTFNTDTLSKLRSDVSILADFTDTLAKQGRSTLKKLYKAERTVASIGNSAASAADSAKSVEDTAKELDNYAKELKALANQYFSKTDLINNKLNATAAAVADLDKVTAQINSQLAVAQNRLVLMDRLKEHVDSHMAMISDLKRRLEYLDKTCAKTVILD